MNSIHARRCIGKDHLGNRCEHFWHYRACPSCQTKNDQVARECRNPECRRMLIDPNAALTGKHYVKGEETPVENMAVTAGSGGKIIVRFALSDGRKPVLIFYPQAGKNPKVNNGIWRNFVAKLQISDLDKKRLGRMKAETIMQNLDLIRSLTRLVRGKMTGIGTWGRWFIG